MRLYFLSFDATVVAPSGVDDFAVVEATLSPDLASLGYSTGATPDLETKLTTLQQSDYKEIYFDWLERTQQLIDETIRVNQSAFRKFGVFLPGSGFNDPTSILEISICTEWLTRRWGAEVHFATRTCQHAARIPHTPVEQALLFASSRKDGEREGQSEHNLDGAAARVFTLLRGGESELVTAILQANQEYTETWYKNLVTTFVKESSSTLLPKLDAIMGMCGPTKGADGSDVWFPDWPVTNTSTSQRLPCPPQFAADDTLIPLVNLLSSMISYDDTPILSDRLPITLSFDRDYLDQKERIVSKSRRPILASHTVVAFPDGRSVTRTNNSDVLNCMAAMAEYDRLNSDTIEVVPGRGERLDQYFELRIEQASDLSCRLLIVPKIGDSNDNRTGANSDKAGTITEADATFLATFQARLDQLGDDGRANRGTHTQAYSYAISPRLQRAYSVHDSTSGQLAAKNAGTEVGVATRGAYSGEAVEAAIVGYEPTAPQDSTSTRAARFGWLIAPERYGAAAWKTGLTIQEAQLGALVSVPSWWRTVLLRICTATLPGSELYKLADGDKAARPFRPANCPIETIRLPGTAAEVANRLGLSVIKFPYLARPDTDTVLTAGRAGSLVLEGGRLWRSTVVLLGSQKATRIEVLPDMEGLIAYFDCVQRPTDVRPDNPELAGLAIPSISSLPLSLPAATDTASDQVPKPAPSPIQSYADQTRGLFDQAHKSEIAPTQLPQLPEWRSVAVPVRVWTSEGATSPINVLVNTRTDSNADSLCPSERVATGDSADQQSGPNGVRSRY